MSKLPLSRRAKRLTLIALAAGMIAALTACAGIELGARPAESIKPVTVAADVKFIQANGLRFAYIEEGTGPLILLLHGYPETARSWASVQRRLATAGYRVVAPFARGYPPTDLAADSNYSIANLGADALALIEALGEKSAIVVGHDWGASAGYTLATTHPEKVRQLVAISVPHPRSLVGDKSFFFEAPHFVYYQFPWAARLAWSHDFAHVDNLYKRLAPNYDPPREVIDDVKATLRAPGAVEAALGYYWTLVKGGGLDRHAAALPVTVPSLVIAGKRDGVFKPERFEAARPAFSGPYQLIEFEVVGHFPQLEAPERTADAILAFVGKGR